jgi:hypothetical protein
LYLKSAKEEQEIIKREDIVRRSNRWEDFKIKRAEMFDKYVKLKKHQKIINMYLI